MEYAVFSRRILTGTIADLPYAARLAWQAVLFEAEKLRGRAKIPIRDLARWAAITTGEAAEAMRRFQEPDPYSSTKDYDGKRLVSLPEEGEDWYQVVSWEKHAEERKVFFARLRKQRQRAREEEEKVTLGHAASRDVTKEPKPEPEPKKVKSFRSATKNEKQRQGTEGDVSDVTKELMRKAAR